MFNKYFARPFQMLFLEPILICITVYLSSIYGILCLSLEACHVAFTGARGWTNQGIDGLPFIGILVGIILGVCVIIYNTKARFGRKLTKHGRVIPEERLVEMMFASVLLPIGLFCVSGSGHRRCPYPHRHLHHHASTQLPRRRVFDIFKLGLRGQYALQVDNRRYISSFRCYNVPPSGRRLGIQYAGV